MSRRRFGDAEGTYRDFISAIDDIEKKRGAARSSQQQQQQSASNIPPPEGPSSVSYQGASALSADVYGSHAPQQSSDAPVTSASANTTFSDASADFAELPVGATEKDTLFNPRQHSFRVHGGHSIQDESDPLLPHQSSQSARHGSDPPHPGDPSGAPSVDHQWLTRRNLDLVIQRKSIWIFVNGMFGVLLMCAVLEVCWDSNWQQSRVHRDLSVPQGYYNDLDWVNDRNSLRPSPIPTGWSWAAVAAECPSPSRSAITESLKVLLSISTAVLLWQVLDRKRLQVTIKLREQRRKLKAKGFNQERDQLYMTSLTAAANVSNMGLLTLQPAQFRPNLWLTLLICVIQPIPFTHQLTHGLIDDKIGILMWIRVCLGFRVVRDCSEIWLNRRSIKHQQTFQSKVPDFDWWLTCKTICYKSPLTFAGVWYGFTLLIFGHALYIAEREYLPTIFNIWTSMFVSFQIVSIGWPADVWEIYMPISLTGKFVSMFAGIAGLILISFVIVAVGAALYPSKFEENALNFIDMEKLRQKEQEGSAALIQYVWKNSQRENELQQKLAPKNPKLYEEITENEEKIFMETFLTKSKELRNIRRERAELEERADPTNEKNISPIDAYFDMKIEAIRTDLMQMKQNHSQQFMTIVASLNQVLHRIHMQEKDKLKKTGQTNGATTNPPTGGNLTRRQRRSASQEMKATVADASVSASPSAVLLPETQQPVQSSVEPEPSMSPRDSAEASFRVETGNMTDEEGRAVPGES